MTVDPKLDDNSSNQTVYHTVDSASKGCPEQFVNIQNEEVVISNDAQVDKSHAKEQVTVQTSGKRKLQHDDAEGNEGIENKLRKSEETSDIAVENRNDEPIEVESSSSSEEENNVEIIGSAEVARGIENTVEDNNTFNSCVTQDLADSLEPEFIAVKIDQPHENIDETSEVQDVDEISDSDEEFQKTSPDLNEDLQKEVAVSIKKSVLSDFKIINMLFMKLNLPSFFL